MATKPKAKEKKDDSPSIEERVKKIEEYLTANASGFRRG
jgi:ribosomal protein L30/L7E